MVRTNAPRGPRRRPKRPKTEPTLDPASTYAPPHHDLGVSVPVEQQIYDSADADAPSAVEYGAGGFGTGPYGGSGLNSDALNAELPNQPGVIEPKHAPETARETPFAVPIDYGEQPASPGPTVVNAPLIVQDRLEVSATSSKAAADVFSTARSPAPSEDNMLSFHADVRFRCKSGYRRQAHSGNRTSTFARNPTARTLKPMPGDRASRLVPLGTWAHYNPHRKFPTGRQGHRGINPETGTTYSPKYSFNLYALNRRNMSFARTGFSRLLTRLRLQYKHEGDHYNLYREVPPEFWFEGGKLFKKEHQPELVYSGTDTSKLVDWVIGIYVPELIRTGTVPGPTLEQQEWAAHRKAREALKAKPKMTRKQAAAKASSRRW